MVHICQSVALFSDFLDSLLLHVEPLVLGPVHIRRLQDRIHVRCTNSFWMTQLCAAISQTIRYIYNTNMQCQQNTNAAATLALRNCGIGYQIYGMHRHAPVFVEVKCDVDGVTIAKHVHLLDISICHDLEQQENTER